MINIKHNKTLDVKKGPYIIKIAGHTNIKNISIHLFLRSTEVEKLAY